MAGTDDNAQTIRDVYAAFTRRDAAGMVRHYAPDVHFSDPVFPDLHGDHARAMWAMLCERGRDLRVEASAIQAEGDRGSAHWEATYTFSPTKRKVVNRIDASFEFRDGLIVRHVDRFDLWRWTRMALGPAGVVLGWTSLIQGRVRREAARGLEAWVARGTR
jgi:ketosteroid isomerase-like protein